MFVGWLIHHYISPNLAHSTVRPAFYPPKSAPSAYQLYIRKAFDARKSQSADAPAKEILSALAKEWEGVCERERSVRNVAEKNVDLLLPG